MKTTAEHRVVSSLLRMAGDAVSESCSCLHPCRVHSDERREFATQLSAAPQISAKKDLFGRRNEQTDTEAGIL